jgi:transposase InsO family protein
MKRYFPGGKLPGGDGNIRQRRRKYSPAATEMSAGTGRQAPSQFTGSAFTGVLTKQSIAISMDGKGAWRDNVFVERLWRTIKYGEVYLRAYESVSDARASIGRYLHF